jgi:MAPEG family
MPKEFFWLMLTIILTGLMWIPYILDRAAVRGLAVTLGNPSPSDKPQSAWAQRMMAAHDNAVENLVLFAPLVLVAHALQISTRHHGRRLRRLLLGPARALHRLYARLSGAAHVVLDGRLARTGGPGAGDFQVGVRPRDQASGIRHRLPIPGRRCLMPLTEITPPGGAPWSRESRA